MIEWEPEGGRLSSGSKSELVQAGIRLFLHQRNQIPVPLEKLATYNKPISVKSISSGDDPDATPTLPRGEKDASLHFNSDVHPKVRIKSLLSQRSKVLQDRKLARRINAALKGEQLAKETITSTLQALDESIQRFKDELHSVALLFGSSVQCPKEVVLFDLSSRSPNRNYYSQENVLPAVDINILTRSFYKAIIMSDQFVDFTSNELNRTRTHLCLLFKEKLDPTRCDELRLLERAQWLSNIEQTDKPYSSQHSSMSIRHKKVKILRVQIGRNRIEEGSDYDSSCSTVSIDDGSYFAHNLIPEMNNPLLLAPVTLQLAESVYYNNSEFFCYQVPLRFKGLLVKHKGF